MQLIDLLNIIVIKLARCYVHSVTNNQLPADRPSGVDGLHKRWVVFRAAILMFLLNKHKSAGVIAIRIGVTQIVVELLLHQGIIQKPALDI